MPAVALGDEETAGDELREMLARGRRGNPRLGCEHAGRKRAAVAESGHDARPCAVAQQGAGGGDVDISGHAAIVVA